MIDKVDKAQYLRMTLDLLGPTFERDGQHDNDNPDVGPGAMWVESLHGELTIRMSHKTAMEMLKEIRRAHSAVGVYPTTLQFLAGVIEIQMKLPEPRTDDETPY